MFILGVSYGYTATAVLLKDGKIIASASEERFNGLKNFNGFPQKAIDYCLKEGGITGQDLDLVTTPYLYLPPSHLPSDLKQRSASNSVIKICIEKVRLVYRWMRYNFPFIRPVGHYLYRTVVYLLSSRYTNIQKSQIANYLKIDVTKVKAYEHHLCHAACGYYSSPLNNSKSLVLTLDGEGDNYSASVSIFDKRVNKVISKTPREYSFGYVFGHVTKFLGMKPHEHEYKVMGLAPYAKDEMVNKVYETIKDTVTFDKDNKLNFYMPFNAQDYNFFLKSKLSEIRFDYIAGAFQKLAEEKISTWVRAAIKKTKLSRVILSGGVFMNVKVNQVIMNMPEVKDMFIMPSCADESAPIGSCYLGYLELTKGKNVDIYPISDLYWGPSYSDSEIKEVIPKNKYIVKKHKEIEKTIAKLLYNGEIIAHLNGRMEWGARALGNRSILANPKNPDVIKEINEMVKNRDFWMPFAPSILNDRIKDYLVNPKNIESKYMMIGFDSTPLAKKELRAALHPYDDTMRPQIVNKVTNERYYKIIKEFEKNIRYWRGVKYILQSTWISNCNGS